MATYIKKDRADILRQALRTLESQTPIKATSPGSVARAFTEAISTELGDLYDALDFNMAQTVVSTATGRALDLLGDLYNVKRKTVSEIVAVDRQVGAFYFYIDSPHGTNITIPSGTHVYTAVDGFVGRQLRFVTTEDAVLVAGRTRVFASIRADFNTAIIGAAVNTLTIHDFTSPPGVIVKCLNPKAIAPVEGYEDDPNYRLRIIKSIRVAASGTIDALRFAALGVSGVRDAKIREVPYGLGSFEIVVTSEEKRLSQASFQEVNDRLEAVRPIGVRMIMRQPTIRPLNISASLITRTIQSETERNLLSKRANLAVSRYLNTLLPGDTVVYNRVIQSILDSSDAIIDVQVTKFAPNGVEALRRNFTPEQDELIVPGSIEVSVAS